MKQVVLENGLFFVQFFYTKNRLSGDKEYNLMQKKVIFVISSER